MKCELIKTADGWKLQEIGTGRFYGYVRGDRKRSEDQLLGDIRAEIRRRGYFEAYEPGQPGKAVSNGD